MRVYFASRKAAVGLAALVLVATFVMGMLIGDVRERIETVTGAKRLVPIYQVDTPDKKIAITIDGVWGAERTPRLLEIFAKSNVRITFFFGGYWIEKYPDVLKEIVAKGHEIGNHTYTHPHCNSLSKEQLRKELRSTSDMTEQLTGKRPRFFRPPFGEYNNQVIETCAEEQMQVIQWNIDSLDWKEPGVHFIVKRVLDNVKPGSIILMHNNGIHTPDALAILVPRLIQMGYQIVPLSELVYQTDYYIENHSGIQKRVVRQGGES